MHRYCEWMVCFPRVIQRYYFVRRLVPSTTEVWSGISTRNAAVCLSVCQRAALVHNRTNKAPKNGRAVWLRTGKKNAMTNDCMPTINTPTSVTRCTFTLDVYNRLRSILVDLIYLSKATCAEIMENTAHVFFYPTSECYTVGGGGACEKCRSLRTEFPMVR